MQKSKTSQLILCALFTAITAATAGISIPLPFTPVPVTLATLAAMLAGGLLGSRSGAASMAAYVILGAFGAPVYAGFTGGFGLAVGPTGGYLAGYILTAYITGLIIEKANTNNILINVPAMVLGTAGCYLLGTVWFMLSTGMPLLASLIACVFPFLPGDALKIAAGAVLVKKLRPILKKYQ